MKVTNKYRSLVNRAHRWCTLPWEGGFLCKVKITVQQHNLHLVVCVNQSHHMLRLARQWNIPVCNARARWVLFQMTLAGAKLGDG